MFGNRKVASFLIYDPGQDTRINLMQVPDDHNYTIEAVEFVADRTLAAGTDAYYSLGLENGGTAGTAQTALHTAVGGTPGWVAQTPQAGAITDGSGRLTAGQWLNVNYAETGTVASGVMTVNIEYVDGIGDTANA